jgi:hypothetical protein
MRTILASSIFSSAMLGVCVIDLGKAQKDDNDEDKYRYHMIY